MKKQVYFLYCLQLYFFHSLVEIRQIKLLNHNFPELNKYLKATVRILSRRNAEKAGVANLARFIEADLYEYDFSEATVISMFLLPEINMKLRPKILKMNPGTRIISNTFTMQEWQYDQVTKTGDESTDWNTAYLWIIPAKVEGKWILSHGGDLIIKQEFQMIKGDVVIGNNKFSISDGRLLGNKITFSAGGTFYTGVVTGEKMEGTITVNGDTKKWSATR